MHISFQASNVLIDHQLNCLISDFKYSKRLDQHHHDDGNMYCASRDLTDRTVTVLTQLAGGIRWQAPEVLMGKSTLRESVDIYAFAVFCTEILNQGEIPWPYWNDDDIRRGVLGEAPRQIIRHFWPIC